MFEDSTFESTGRIRTHSRRWMTATLGLNAAVVAALILIPLIYPEALPRQALAILLNAPAPPQQLAPMPKTTARTFQGTPEIDRTGITAPSRIPQSIRMVSGPEQAPGSGDLAQWGEGTGIPGGVGIRDSYMSLPVVQEERHGPTAVSSGVMAGQLVYKVTPTYPAIGVAVRAEGTVVLQATISKTGSIEHLRVLSGPPMLQQSALDAVQRWRYRPYLLNNQPVEVETTINVVFTLAH